MEGVKLFLKAALLGIVVGLSLFVVKMYVDTKGRYDRLAKSQDAQLETFAEQQKRLPAAEAAQPQVDVPVAPVLKPVPIVPIAAAPEPVPVPEPAHSYTPSCAPDVPMHATRRGANLRFAWVDQVGVHPCPQRGMRHVGPQPLPSGTYRLPYGSVTVLPRK